MFMSLSSTTRTVRLSMEPEATSVLRGRASGSRLRRARRVRSPVLRVGEELRVEVDLGGLPELLDLLHRLVLLHLRGDALLHLAERPRVALAHLEDVDAVARRDGGADLP